MRRLFVMCFVLALTAGALAQDASAPLQGRWVVVDGEHNGKPMKGLESLVVLQRQK